MRVKDLELRSGEREGHAGAKTVYGAALTGCRCVSRIRPLGVTRVFAEDWGAELELGRPAGDAQFVGIRTHDIQEGDGENALRCRVLDRVENPFSCTLRLRPPGGSGESELLWRTSKKHTEAMQADELTIRMPREALLVLKE